MSKVAVLKPTPPEATKAKTWPSIASVNSLAVACDSLRQELRGIERGFPHGWVGAGPEGRATIERRAEVWRRNGGVDRHAYAVELFAECLPADGMWWDDEGTVLRSGLSVVLAQLVGSFPTANLPNAAVFTKMMLEDVWSQAPGYVEMVTTCGRLRRTSKFMPAICEVLDALEIEEAAWRARGDALDSIAQYLEPAT